jgi:peptidoglycan-associated lipoprotein
MKRNTAGFLMMVGCGALLAGGCAKTEVVKKDQPMAPSTMVAPVKVQPKQEQAKTNQMEKSPVAKEVAKETAAPAAAVTGTEQAAELKKGLEKVYFNFDSAALSDQARNTLVKDADLMKKIDKVRIRVEGNCDERGSDDYNLALGEKRAKEAVQYLANLGIPADRLSVISYGKEKPVATGHDEASWSKNRRDEFVVLP